MQLDNFNAPTNHCTFDHKPRRMKKVIVALRKFGSKNKKKEEAHSAGIIEDTAAGTLLSILNSQIPGQHMQTPTGHSFLQNAENNRITNSNITNIGGNQTNHYYESGGPFFEANKIITQDMIASATPAAPMIFKGREELVEQGVAILCQQGLRFLAILGAGGIGKTSLALHIMNYVSVKKKFAERCYFIPCELFEDAESLVRGLIHVMELTMQENQSKQKVLFNHLQFVQGDLLIVFDNFETPWNHGDSRIVVKNLLEKIAMCGKVSLIVTMRGPDGPGDIPWEILGDQSGIPTLSPISAKEAFKAFAGNKLQSSDDSESQIDSLLYQIEYVPLAIRLSAQHVKKIPLAALISLWEKDKTSVLTEGRVPGRLTSTQYDKAINMNLQARKYFKQSENQWSQAISMSWLSEIYCAQARYKEGSEMILEAQQLFQQVGNELGVTECLKRLGDIYRMQGRNDEAIKMISDAQKQFQTFGNQMRAAECLWSLGELYRVQKKYDKATEMIMKSQKQSEEIGDKQRVAFCLLTLGCIYMDQAQYDEAVNMFSNAQMQYQNIGMIVDVPWCYQYLGETYRLQGQYGKAKEALTEALELLNGFSGEKYRMGCTLLHFGHLFFDMKDFVEAKRKYEEAENVFNSHGQLEKEADYCSWALAKLGEAIKQ
ncbi:TPR-like protein [Dendrothele bispora CBS 962.96]|uniref:TPR-like protein n=1 Tax=Dendrothele bispora (strain CBS 962.96) TaxID=1314807 RepID=A0A4S8LSJ3_DENBC|nr:TPR-like protein [Dendrothele bispora CBS 962.96]